MIKSDEIRIPLDFIESKLELIIYGDRKNSSFTIDFEFASENGMSAYQILEGCFYNYYFHLDGKSTQRYQLRENVIVKNSQRKDVSEGRIAPNTYVGSLPLTIHKTTNETNVAEFDIEVIATKLDDRNIPTEDMSYRKNYQFMLKDIADKCTELLMQINSPITQNFEIDHSRDHQTVYQRFAFVSALISNNEFNDAVQKILSSPKTKWVDELEFRDVRSVRKFKSSSIRQIVSRNNRVKLSRPIGKLKDVPIKIEVASKTETFDTPENRFIKYAIEIFLHFCISCKETFDFMRYEKSKLEAQALVEKLENYLSHPFFKEVNRPVTLKLNSPTLQRKSGYRELLNAWLQFDLAAKLIWKGGDDVYKAGKRDVAVLYEYWLFFILYDLLKSKFNLNRGDNYNSLIESTNDGLNVMLKSGKFIAIEGNFKSEGRDLHIKFSYNRTFEGGVEYSGRKQKSGSWTKPLRPDYTLSIWPDEIKSEEEAEEQEKIVHIHFDSKYKVQQFFINTIVESDLPESDDDSMSADVDSRNLIDSLEKEKREERKGFYKNADLLKMHAYKDAIRRTGGAYVLYPGSETQLPFRGFHELIPGLGAFAIRPTEGDNGSSELSDFMDEIISHFNNMASQQRRQANSIYQIFKDIPNKRVNEPMPHYIIPDETSVIVAYYKSDFHLAWIKDRMKYNGRIGNVRGAMSLTPEYIGAHYIVLHTNLKSNLEIFKIDQSEGFKPSVISSADDLFNLNVPKYPDSRNPFYLVFSLLEKEKGFLDREYDISKLSGYSIEEDAFPFTCTLTDFLIKAKKS